MENEQEKTPLIAFGFCRSCNEKTPVLTQQVNLKELLGFGEDALIPVIFCIQCESLLNNEDEVELEYYKPEDLPQMGWELNDSELPQEGGGIGE